MKNIVLILALAVTSSANAECARYDVDTRLLSIDNVAVGDVTVTDVIMGLNADGVFNLLSYSVNQETVTPPIDPPIESECAIDHNITQQLQIGMTLHEVNTIVGCEGEIGLSSESQVGVIEQYQWIQEEGLSLTVLFLDGVLTSSTIF